MFTVGVFIVTNAPCGGDVNSTSGGRRGVWEIESVFSAQFRCEFKAALKVSL